MERNKAFLFTFQLNAKTTSASNILNRDVVKIMSGS